MNTNTIKLVNDGVRLIEDSALAYKNPFKDQQIAQANAIREIVASITKTARPEKQGEYVVGYQNSPVRRVVTVLRLNGAFLVMDSDYPVGKSIEEYGAAWYCGPFAFDERGLVDQTTDLQNALTLLRRVLDRHRNGQPLLGKDLYAEVVKAVGDPAMKDIGYPNRLLDDTRPEGS